MINEEHTCIPQHIKPRLQHIEPGQFFTPKHHDRYQLLRKDGKYGYVENAKFALSTELEKDGMVFGDGKGWRKRHDA